MAQAVMADALALRSREARRRSVLMRERSHDGCLTAVRLHFRHRQLRRSVVGRIYAMDESGTGQLVDRVGVVLVADDDPELRQSLKELLELSGHRVLVAADGAEALDILRQHDVDVLVLDMKMPVLDGWSVLRELDRRGPAVIVNSGDDFSTDEVLTFFETRTFGILRKPTPPLDLLGAVDSAVARLRVADERDRVADERERVADERERVADERDVVADARDVVADERDRMADDRDLRAARRQDGDDSGATGSTSWSEALLARTRAAIDRSVTLTQETDALLRKRGGRGSGPRS